MDAPEELRGQKIRCPKCNFYEEVAGPNTDIKNTASKKLLVLISLIILGIILAFYLLIYSSELSFEKAKRILGKQGLFLTNTTGEKAILRGRVLNKYEFTQDASDPFVPSSFSLWLDENNKLVGIDCAWFGDCRGFPVLLSPDTNDILLAKAYFRSWATYEGFRKVMGFNIDHLLNENYVENHRGYRIQVIKEPTFFEMADYQKDLCKLLKMEDDKIYTFIVIAQKW